MCFYMIHYLQNGSLLLSFLLILNDLQFIFSSLVYATCVLN
ncbi:putative membrane protein [Chlamydia avium]|uniref:Membrane protein n=1 Tax=Chlamydia avium TaxID=1457141 RepID=A0ABP2X668_9CHLA|nr:putative membrane protein [Chlamydia avium]